MLKITNLNVYYGAIHALKSININIEEGEIVTLIGSNGAGKTSTLKAISGVIPCKSGAIEFQGKNITNVAPHKLVRAGIGHVPEGRRIFSELTVMENLELGAYTRRDSGIKSDYEKVFEKFPRLKERIKQDAGTLSGGEQQMLAIGRALMSKPKLLLLDEPSMGLAPIVVKQIFSTIKEINNNGTTILLVEQNANMALSIADRAYIIETGSIVNCGMAEQIKENDEVKKAYLG